MKIQMNKKLYQYGIIILDVLTVIAFLWFRFIRQRLPKEIPLNLSFVGLILLITTISLFIYIVISLFKEIKPNPILQQLVAFIYLPLEALDHYIKNHPYINKTYKQCLIYLLYKLDFLIINNSSYYYLCQLAPRFILLSVLFLDTFILHKLMLIYKVLLLGVIILLSKYIIYSFKYAKDHFTVYLESFVTIIMPYEYACQALGEEDDDDIPETRRVPLKDFLIFQVGAFIDNEKFSPYTVLPAFYDYHYYKQQGILLQIEQKVTPEELEARVKNLLQIYIVLFYYDFTSHGNKEIKNLKRLIYINYLLCWSYILIVSLPSLYYASLWELSIIFSIQESEEPFSGIDFSINY